MCVCVCVCVFSQVVAEKTVSVRQAIEAIEIKAEQEQQQQQLASTAPTRQVELVPAALTTPPKQERPAGPLELDVPAQLPLALGEGLHRMESADQAGVALVARTQTSHGVEVQLSFGTSCEILDFSIKDSTVRLHKPYGEHVLARIALVAVVVVVDIIVVITTIAIVLIVIRVAAAVVVVVVTDR